MRVAKRQTILADSKLLKLLPTVDNTSVNIKKRHKFKMSRIKPDRCKKSFIILNSLKA